MKKGVEDEDNLRYLIKMNTIYGAKALFVFICIVFVAMNIFMSQSMPSLYYSFVNEDKASVVSFLQKIKHISDYPWILKEQREIFGPAVQAQVYASDAERKQVIMKLEQLLQKNTKSRDVLYSLYLLYDQDGNQAKAEDYLRQARTIDPLIGEK